MKVDGIKEGDLLADNARGLAAVGVRIRALGDNPRLLASLQSRRRRPPVITSTRRYESGIMPGLMHGIYASRLFRSGELLSSRETRDGAVASVSIRRGKGRLLILEP